MSIENTQEEVKMEEFKTTEYETMKEAFAAAAEAAVATFGRPVSGILYTQAGRRFISTSLPT
jgi:hypothetical protein